LYSMPVLRYMEWYCPMVFMVVAQEEAARLNRQGTSYGGPLLCSAYSRQASLLTMNDHGMA
jgi:hypothetical protein